MNHHIFRAYDIRGIVPDDITIDEFKPLTTSIIRYLRKNHTSLKTIVVGRDGRTHSPAIHAHVVQAIINAGIDVIDIGLCPTPLMYFAMHTRKVDAGIMITASHNPGNYNGLKICLGKKSLWGKSIQDIQTIYSENQHFAHEKKAPGKHTVCMIAHDYITWMLDSFPLLKNSTMPLLIDCGNGATGPLVRMIIETFNWENVSVFFDEVDGYFPNHEPDPTNAQNMQHLSNHLKHSDTKAIGIGFDGDGDRMSAFMSDGTLVQSDQLLSIFAQDIVTKYPGATVVSDIKSSASLLDHLKSMSAQSVLSACGHAIIKETMLEHKALLGGELSGHFFFADAHFGFDDGIYAMMRLLDLLQRNATSLYELVSALPQKISSPEIRLDCPDEKKHSIIDTVTKSLEQKPCSISTIDGVRATFSCGWGLLRASNTQPALSMRFEANTHQELSEIVKIFTDALAPFLDTHKIYEKLSLPQDI